MNLKLINNPELFNKVVAAGKANSHELVSPNIVVLDRQQQIIGAVSVLPMHLVWMDTTKCKVRDSLQLKETLESNISLNGGKLFCMPCSKLSPYYSLLPKDNFLNLGSYDLFIKQL